MEPAVVMHIGSDQLQVEVLPELGARLHRLRAFGEDLLRTPDDLTAYRDEPFFWGSFVMAPWCNRVAAGPRRVGEAVVNLPANFGDGTAIHGQVQALPWEVVAPGTLRVTAGGDGWPWRYEVTQRLAVEGVRLRLLLELVNRSTEPMPAGIGIHPWFVRPLEIALPAERVFTSNVESSPYPEPVAGPYDLRPLREMPPDLDATWVISLQEPVSLRWPDLRVEAALRFSPEASCVCAASPTALGAVAVEPQTHAPNGLRRLLYSQDGGMTWLQPEESLRLQVEISFALS